MSLKAELSAALAAFLKSKGSLVPEADVEGSFEPPREEKFGDLSTSVVLRASKELKQNPRALGEEAAKALLAKAGPRVSRITVDGPGFLNIAFAPAEIGSVLSEIHKQGASFGKPKVAKKKILLEFVSANPTGPLTVAHGRQAALGDSLAKILRFCGHDVTAEYYNNDEGVQIQTLGKSLKLRVDEIVQKKQLEVPENYYRGEYMIDIARRFVAKNPDPSKAPAQAYEDFAADDIGAGIKKDLADFGVTFDNYYSQKALGQSGRVEKTLEKLKAKGIVFENEGAWWLRSTDYGDDKDRVLVKSDKTYTYLTPDIAYHDHKFERGFEKLIGILGPDHHGYIARLKASQAALGHDPAKIHILIAQLVTLFEDGQEMKMSTRAGQFVTLRQILDEVGKDAGRFFFVMRKFDAHLDFDLALAKTQTNENPAFYIQYAHARICSLKEKFGSKFWDESLINRLDGPHERTVMRLLSQFEDAIEGAERTLEPYRLVPYLQELAAAFSRFYTENRVITDDRELSRARLMLADGVRQVLAIGLTLLGVSVPEKM